jgi:tetratricopeptide (TPR) repeat protein
VAALARQARQAENRGDVEDTLEVRRKLCHLEPERPEHELALADSMARAGLFAEAHQVLVKVLSIEALTAALRAATAQREGDVALAQGDLAAAASAYDRALAQPVSDGLARVLKLGRLGAGDPELAPLVARYLARYEDDTDALTEAVMRTHLARRIQALPGYGALGSYLAGVQLLNIQAHEQAVPLLERALNPRSSDGRLPGPRFVAAAHERLFVAYLVTGRLSRAETILDRMEALPDLRSGDRQALTRHRERLAFFRQSGAGDRSAPTDPTR